MTATIRVVVKFKAKIGRASCRERGWTTAGARAGTGGATVALGWTSVAAERAGPASWPGRLVFSSRRRHTRWPRDWSSDVCSSDLNMELAIPHSLDLKCLVQRASGLLLEKKKASSN